MDKLFVSFHYHADDHGRGIEGFENDVLDLPDTPIDATFIDHLTHVVETRALEQLGVRGISCTVLYFKEIKQ